ncbi:MAG: HlyD family efflux transporter periplasmic adaptor subunit [Acidipropionibacterium acidipropionici]|jgi:multidrug resistance efflux pump|uniref:Biotin/lipoyl attachment domain-containing protein n=1 Tax=Acidipropionibacterium acidipropionici (strain ATCC 4875 / DSM 20272 / JCM 6432 / NBRC 12425 / NCIMB 8070 / 4) TaxID=1171373 RepID=K7RND6_ACIA4|nr:HlyD family efflux transporter periplasmic adaptor subunit [Acidipropionibacterium acidipropionici]AFV89489.1 Biotin/lipoyl attachment domain-containing protein [Acidipropionibacterium acidipropionici ATCC 4875]
MTMLNRLKLLIGIILVLAIGCSLILLFNQRQARVNSRQATVQAPVATVGAAYSGVVTALNVTNGKRVHKGDLLMTTVSQDLQQAVALGAHPTSNIAFDVNLKASTITYKAAADGYVSGLEANVGSFVPAGAQIASVVGDAARSVVGTFELDPTQYQRAEIGAPVQVLLPDNTRLPGTVTDIEVTTSAGSRTSTRISVACPDLADPRYQAMARLGSPVSAIVTLRDDGILAGPTDAWMTFLTKIGLR